MTQQREPALRIRVAGPGVRPGRMALADLMHVGRHLQPAAPYRLAKLLTILRTADDLDRRADELHSELV